ncbi:haloacid dehalogenase superfamily protein, subfamily IA, variant 3 with third motif having DD or ED [Leptolyngbya sp. PCC 7375]|nr:haloacid dehalogenase superfamily protein, subfamily IA, variant 3 with third motif having DD or ED [Leptolyngbya sp. PCC 7375]
MKPCINNLAVIFDFNGVLVFDSPIHEAAWNEFATQHRGYPMTEKEIETYVHGRTNHQILNYLIDQHLSITEEQKLAGEKEDLYRQLCLKKGDLFCLSPGAVTLINDLRAKQIPYTIATSSGRDNIDFYIKELNLGSLFNLSDIIFDDGTLPGKPAPDIYLKAAEVLKKEPKYCIVIEDSLSGIASANNAGIGHIIALSEPQKHHSLREVSGVTSVVGSLAEISLFL